MWGRDEDCFDYRSASERCSEEDSQALWFVGRFFTADCTKPFRSWTLVHWRGYHWSWLLWYDCLIFQSRCGAMLTVPILLNRRLRDKTLAKRSLIITLFCPQKLSLLYKFEGLKQTLKLDFVRYFEDQKSYQSEWRGTGGVRCHCELLYLVCSNIRCGNAGIAEHIVHRSQEALIFANPRVFGGTGGINFDIG